MAAALPSIRVLLGTPIAMGPGKARLLEAIRQQGSISGAARAIGMSYRRAWMMVDGMNRNFRKPLVETAAGGRRGGGAMLTALGGEVLSRYRRLEDKAAACCRDEIEGFASLLGDDGIPQLPGDWMDED
jgi:molybdate transport system regulatory protein